MIDRKSVEESAFIDLSSSTPTRIHGEIIWIMDTEKKGQMGYVVQLLGKAIEDVDNAIQEGYEELSKDYGFGGIEFRSEIPDTFKDRYVKYSDLKEKLLERKV